MTSSTSESEAALQAGNGLFVDEKYEEALQQYTQALLLHPNEEAFLKRATCHYKLDNFAGNHLFF